MNDNPTMQEQIDALPPETPDRVIYYLEDCMEMGDEFAFQNFILEHLHGRK